MLGIKTAASLIASLAHLGIVLTEKQVLDLKWRMSEEGKKYYSRKETNEFYEAVRKGKTDVIDIIRKEKQQKINELKQKFGIVAVIFISLFITGCSTIIKNDHLDVGALKRNEHSYAIRDVKVYCYKGGKDVYFEGEWFIVHPDYIKEHMENQDSLIKLLEEQVPKDRMFKIVYWIMCALILVIFTLLVRLYGVKNE